MHGRRINNFEGPQYVFRDPGFPLFEVRDSGFESKIGASFGIESMHGSGMPSITLGVKGLHEILSRDCKIEEPYRGSLISGEREKCLLVRPKSITIYHALAVQATFE